MNSNCCRNSKPQFKHGDWKREHAERLHLQFLRVEIARQRGKSVTGALLPFHYYWRGKTYRADSKIKVRFSLSTLRRLYYGWVAGGRKLELLALKYNPRRHRVSKRFLLGFLKHCAQPQTLSLRAAYVAYTGKRPAPISYTTALRYIGGSEFRAWQRQLRIAARATARAENLIGQTRAKIESFYRSGGAS